MALRAVRFNSSGPAGGQVWINNWVGSAVPHNPPNCLANDTVEASLGIGGTTGMSFSGQASGASLLAGLIWSYTRNDGVNSVLAVGNITAGALNNPAYTVNLLNTRMSVPVGGPQPGHINAIRKGTSGRVYGFAGSVTIDHGLIAAASTLEAIGNIFFTGFPLRCPYASQDIVIASPRAALPAGLVFSHCRPTALEDVRITLGNMTGAGIDPGPITYDCFIMQRPQGSLSSVARIPPQKKGAFMLRPFQFNGLDHGNIVNATVVEATIDLAAVGLRGIAPGMPVYVEPTASLPAGIALSHARISAGNTLAIGLANVSIAPIDPAAQNWKIAVFEEVAT